MIKNGSKIFVSDLSKKVILFFICSWGETLSIFLILGNFHPKILGAVAILLALLIQYVFLTVSKINDNGNFYIKLGISLFIPVKYFLMGLFALLLPEGKFSLGAYFFSMIAGFVFLNTGARNSLKKK